MARHEPRGQRSLVLASLPGMCQVCEGTGRVRWRHPLCGPAKTTECPHCAVARPMPIYVYPMREDLPRGVA